MKNYTTKKAMEFARKNNKPDRFCRIIDGKLCYGTKSTHMKPYGRKFCKLIRLNRDYFRA
jgi:hypothetical protein